MQTEKYFDESRFVRQIRYQQLGAEGQQKLSQAHVGIVGCGALGSATAVSLTRAGIGTLTIIDRDIPEWSNLPRQLLYTEKDVRDGLPKAIIAEQRLREIDSNVHVIPHVADLTAHNISDLLASVDIIVDGTDNFETRFLMNDFACRENTPWIYGGVIGAEGRVMTVIPGKTACLRCLIPDLPTPGSLPTCNTAGVLGAAVMVVAGTQTAETIKVIVNPEQDTESKLFVFDLWDSTWKTIDLRSLSEVGCLSCQGDDHEWLDTSRHQTAILCGQDAVQFHHPGKTPDLCNIAKNLSCFGNVTENKWLVRTEVEPGIVVSVFADGRLIVTGTRDPSQARAIVSKCVGM